MEKSWIGCDLVEVSLMVIIAGKKTVKKSELVFWATITSQDQDHIIIIDISVKTFNQCSVQSRKCVIWMLRSVEDSRWRKDVREAPGFLFRLGIRLHKVLGWTWQEEKDPNRCVSVLFLKIQRGSCVGGNEKNAIYMGARHSSFKVNCLQMLSAKIFWLQCFTNITPPPTPL